MNDLKFSWDQFPSDLAVGLILLLIAPLVPWLITRFKSWHNAPRQREEERVSYTKTLLSLREEIHSNLHQLEIFESEWGTGKTHHRLVFRNNEMRQAVARGVPPEVTLSIQEALIKIDGLLGANNKTTRSKAKAALEQSAGLIQSELQRLDFFS